MRKFRLVDHLKLNAQFLVASRMRFFFSNFKRDQPNEFVHKVGMGQLCLNTILILKSSIKNAA